jgi:PAS domain S-box-containing protein
MTHTPGEARRRVPQKERIEALEARLAQAEAALQAAEERAARLEAAVQAQGGVDPGALLSSLPVGIAALDAGGRQVLFCNQHASRLLGLADLDLAGLTRALRQYVRQMDGTPYFSDQCPVARMRRGEAVLGEPIQYKLPEGVTTPLLMSTAPVTVGEQVAAWVVVIEDARPRQQAAEQMRAQEERLRLVQDAARLGAWEWRPGWDYSINNDIFFQLHGLEPAPGGRVYLCEYVRLVHPEDHNLLIEDILRAERGEPSRNFPFRILRPDGEVRWLQSYRKNIYEDGVLVRQIGAVRDITEQVRYEEELRAANQALEETRHTLETSEARFRLLVSSINDTAFTLDPQQRYTGIYGRMLDRYRIQPEMLLGKDPVEILGEAGALVHLDANRRALAGEEVVYEWSPPAAQGCVIFQTRLSLMRSETGEVLGIVGVSRDITHAKQTEADLEEYARRLEESNRELQSFAFVASHDLQEPVRKIRAFADSLYRRTRSVLPPEDQELLERTRSAAERMHEMINDLLELSRVSTQGRPFSSVDLRRVTAEVLTDLEVVLERTGGQVELGDLPPVLADRVQVRQLLLNLIHNALKYHRPGVPPHVRISGELLRADSLRRAVPVVRLVVEDSGIGFDPENAERIFQPFQRLHGRSQYEGTGMGLAICKKIAERHGGSISAESRPGEGSQFVVILPGVPATD